MSRRTDRIQARLEDLHFLVDTGENLTGAVRRLNLTAQAIEIFCRRQGYPELFATLKAREPTEPFKNVTERSRFRPVRRTAA